MIGLMIVGMLKKCNKPPFMKSRNSSGLVKIDFRLISKKFKASFTIKELVVAASDVFNG